MAKCGATLVLGDDYEDNPTTFHCDDEAGHCGRHGERSGRYTIEWEGDDRRQCVRCLVFLDEDDKTYRCETEGCKAAYPLCPKCVFDTGKTIGFSPSVTSGAVLSSEEAQAYRYFRSVYSCADCFKKHT